MGIAYRTKHATATDADLKQMALVKEEMAYGLEIEVKRREALPEDHKDRDGAYIPNGQPVALDALKKEAGEHRLNAFISTQATGCTADEIRKVRKELLDRWLEQVETNHQSLSLALDQVDKVLSMNGEAPVDEKQKSSITKKHKELASLKEDIEVSWSVVTQELDALTAPDDEILGFDLP